MGLFERKLSFRDGHGLLKSIGRLAANVRAEFKKTDAKIGRLQAEVDALKAKSSGNDKPTA